VQKWCVMWDIHTTTFAVRTEKRQRIYLDKDSGIYNRARHIDTPVYRIRELASEPSPEVRLFKIAGEDQPSDLFTKGLPRPAFEKHRAILMGEVPCDFIGTDRQVGRHAFMGWGEKPAPL